MQAGHPVLGSAEAAIASLAVEIRALHTWPSTAGEAEVIQDRLKAMVDLIGPGPDQIRHAAGLDVAYAKGSERLAAAVAVLDATSCRTVETAVAVGSAAFAYVPGLFAFRELPGLVNALRQLRLVPDLLVCDGHGIAHPRRFGLACHVGVLTGLPTVGAAKAPLVGEYEQPARGRGSWTDLRDGREVVGRVLRTQDGVKPVFVSVGHRIDLDTACRHVLALCPRYRLPETTRAADRASCDALASGNGASPRVRRW